MEIKDFMDVTHYRISEGSAFLWQCFGENAYSLDSNSGSGAENEYSAHMVFDTVTQEVYLMEVCDYTRRRAYRYFNPEYKTVYMDEVIAQGANDEAYDDVTFTDLDVYGDFLEKTQAIVEGHEYDDRVEFMIDVPDNDLFTLMKMAHARDLTFNDFMAEVIEETIAREKHRELNETPLNDIRL